jgi:hypothetical protein
VDSRALQNPVILTGHSLGGVLAGLATMDLALMKYNTPNDRFQLYFIGFGTPVLLTPSAVSVWNILRDGGFIQNPGIRYETMTPGGESDIVAGLSGWWFDYKFQHIPATVMELQLTS